MLRGGIRGGKKRAEEDLNELDSVEKGKEKSEKRCEEGKYEEMSEEKRESGKAMERKNGGREKEGKDEGEGEI